MTFMFLATYFYVKFYEKKSFSEGFNFSFKSLGRNVLWALVFTVIDALALHTYLFLIVKPLTKEVIIASSGIGQQAPPPFWSRLIEYLYIVYEGIIEVFIFIGFLFDRLWKRWGWPLALLVGNIAFGLWHYSYWSKGLLEGSLMIILTIISGIIHSINYMKTKNSLSPAITHFLTDSPMAIRILLGMMH
jgi:membrane protease YdiL (CAAX protease family)